MSLFDIFDSWDDLSWSDEGIQIKYEDRFELLPEDLKSGRARKILKRTMIGRPDRSKEIGKLTKIIAEQFQAGAKRLILRFEIKGDNHSLAIFLPDDQSSDVGREFVPASPPPLQIPPGLYLRRLAEFLFSRKTYDYILAPILRDLCDEYCEALAANRPWKTRWVRIRGYWSFWSAVFAQLPISTVKMVYKIWQATR